jgi:glycosyltransferase involved in cell wall biosynthesis
MRIVHLAAYGGPYPGSFVPMLKALDRAAAERGWSFEAVFTPIAATRPWYAEMAAEGLAVRVAPDEGRRALTDWLSELVAEQADTPTILHTHFSAFDLPAVAVARSRPNVRVFWHLHSVFGRSLTARLRNAFKFAVVGRRVEGILCVSADLRNGARRRLAPARRLVVLPNAVDLEHFVHATAEERSAARTELGLPANRSLLVHFGWHWETKGGDLFVETIAELLRAGVEVTGVCVGDADAARAARERLGVEDDVVVLAARDDVRTLYAAADVFVSTSQGEGATSFAVLEALATGTPVVASAIPNHILLAERSVGCAISERDSRAFAQAVRSVLSARSAGQFPVDISGLADSLDLDAWAERVMALYAAR